MRIGRWIARLLAAAVWAAVLTGTAAAGGGDGHWAAAAVERWYDCGILDESGGLFLWDWDAPLSRGQTAEILDRLLGLRAEAENVYSDLPEDGPHTDAVLRCAAAGILEGSGGRIRPEAPVTREEAAVLVCRALQLEPLPRVKAAFEDGACIADWADGYVAALVSRGLMRGTGEARFSPTAAVSLAELATLLDRAVAVYAGTAGESAAGSVSGITVVAAPGVTVTGRCGQLLAAPGAAGTVRLTGDVERLLVSGGVHVALEAGADVYRAELGDRVRMTVERGAKAGTVRACGAGVQIAGAGSVEEVMAEGDGTVVETGGTAVRAADGAHGTVAGGQPLQPGSSTVTALPAGPSGEAPAEQEPEEPPEEPETPGPEPEEPGEETGDAEPEEPYTIVLAEADHGSLTAPESGAFPAWPEQLAVRFTPETGYVLAEAALTLPDGTVRDITDEVLRSDAGKLADTFQLYTVPERPAGTYTVSAVFVPGARVYTAEELAAALTNQEPGRTVFLGADIRLDGVLGEPYGNVTRQFSGTLDGDGHALWADHANSGYLMQYNSGNVTIRDLTVVQNQHFVTLIGIVNGEGMEPADVLLENITVRSEENTVVRLEQQEASFLGAVRRGAADTEIVFRGCTNEANLVLCGDGTGTGLFIGGAVGRKARTGAFGSVIPEIPYSGRIVFENCRNRGTLTGAHLGFFVGSDAGTLDVDAVVVENCRNTGSLLATQSVGWLAVDSGDAAHRQANESIGLLSRAINSGIMQTASPEGG